MQCVNEPFEGVKVLEPRIFSDQRGVFVKTFHERMLADLGINMIIREEFFSTSKKGVIRGMHFQIPPQAHQKIVYCITGSVIDVLLDLRKESKTYGKSCSFELSARNHRMIYIPVGIAHGFLSLEDDSCMIYKTDTTHHPEYDRGIRWNSFDYDWHYGDCVPIISERDSNFPCLNKFLSPF